MPSLSLNTPVGRLTLDETDEAIVGVRWCEDAQSNGSPLLLEAARQLSAYLDGKLTAFDLPLGAAGSQFEQAVWAAMCAIPYGQTRSYGDVAHELDSGPRAVGRACGRNPIPIIVPCHRILGRSGMGGYSGGTGLPTKQWLLGLEGVLLRAA
ncbi:MAG: methylated-DNA--[protein]-cysteine S-methyltransferase [Alphaproteobacteria bacterium]|nr:methylated-DNA--[protein]-cysteine S-methyltransferase [Alphaproteobacteria bacterium]